MVSSVVEFSRGCNVLECVRMRACSSVRVVLPSTVMEAKKRSKQSCMDTTHLYMYDKRTRFLCFWHAKLAQDAAKGTQ